MTKVDRAGHSRDMRFLVPLVAAMSVGCLIPVNVGEGERDGETRGSGTACTPSEVIANGGKVATNLSLVLADCSDTGVTVRAPDGSPVDANVAATGGNMTVAFTPPTAGVYAVEFVAGGESRSIALPVDDLQPRTLTVGTTRRYVDRIDECSGYFTTRGRLVCRLGADTAIYDVDGSHLITFSNAYVGVAGSSLWTIYDGKIEHRSETDAGFVFDGAFESAGISLSNNDPFSLREDRAAAATAVGLVTATWDGSSVDGGVEFPTVDFRAGLGNYARPAVVENGVLWDSALCRVEPACQSRVCEPIRHCDYPGASLRTISLSERSMWLATGDLNSANTLQLVDGPFSRVNPRSPVRPVPANFDVNTPEFNLSPPFMYEYQTPHRLAAIPQGASFYFLHVTGLFTVTDDHIVSMVDPFTLRFTPR
ncbi:MAG: hypothetical protein ACO1OB_06130 [Archangium sp.]